MKNKEKEFIEQPMFYDEEVYEKLKDKLEEDLDIKINNTKVDLKKMINYVDRNGIGVTVIKNLMLSEINRQTL